MLRKNISKKEQKISKGFKGLPKSGWITVLEDTPKGYKPRSSRQKTFSGELLGDLEIGMLNPKIQKYRDLRKEGYW